MPDNGVLELRNVSVSYPRRGSGDNAVLSGFGMRCLPGDLLCIQGRSGSGKTTLLHVAAGLIRPRRGTVLWDDESIWDHSESWRRGERRQLIGYVMQGGGLIEALTARENVLLAALAGSRDAKSRADGLLERFGLGELADRFPFELSGGEQQRVAVSRALIGDPRVLLVDEPTASLDRTTADGVIDYIARLATEGRAVVVASHDDHVVERATRHVLLE